MELTWAAGKPGDEDTLLSFQSDTGGAYHGRLEQGPNVLAQSGDPRRSAQDSKEAAALWDVNAAIREAEFGRTAAAKQAVTNCFGALAPGRDVNVLAALALARAGDVSRAKSLIRELEKKLPIQYSLLKH